MRVAYCIRKDYKSRGGGDVIQMLMTKEHIESNFPFIEIEIVTDAEFLNESFDICHIFNYSTAIETLSFFKKAKKLKLKIASSTIYWDYSATAYQYFCKLGLFNLNRISLNTEIFLLRLLQLFYPIFFLTSKKFKNYCALFLKSSDIILPNSIEEYKLLLSFTGFSMNDFLSKVVHNSTLLRSTDSNSGKIMEKYNIPSNYVLQVGRIEPIKNQLNLLKALSSDNHIPIVFVGKIFDDKYFKELKRYGDKRGNVYFIEEVSHEEVFEIYRGAHTHVLPSLRESPGLVSLEAYSQGCNIVCSQFPYSPFDTYFSDIAYSIDPLSLSSIRDAVIQSYKDGKQETNFKLLKNFSWDYTAKQTMEAYESILNS
ncbi:glycosyltransferase [Sphingobacterium multivorum]|uniref:glycosyltransferase n=1 Tax=Sphingobacterium multivorum TaxID=28454 RepID=UPI0028B1969A|nr:glycosyltransferase [Sphingobacterium multivorum]